MAERQVERMMDLDRRELLAKLLRAEGIHLSAEQPAPAQKLAVPTPLSFSQERLWFLDQLDPGSAAYHIGRALRLRGALKRDAMVRAIGEIVRRHEILRTAFSTVDDRPVQLVTDLKIDVPLINLRRWPSARREKELRRVLNQEMSVPFFLDRGPLFRARLIGLGKAEHALLLVCHQIVCDGSSMNLLLRELAALYRSFITGRTPELPDLPIQYSDYTVRLRAQHAGSAPRRQLAYWRGRLQNSSFGIAIATDRPRPALQSFRGARVPLAVPAALAARLRELGRSRRATPFMVLMAAFKVLLWRYARQDDLCVGFPAANRNQRGVEDLIGLFVNTLVLRTDLSGNPTFVALLEQVREHCRGALAHQDLPFEKIVEELQRDRDLSRSPLFQVMFVFQDLAADFSVPGLEAEYLELESTTAKFDLTLSLTESDSGFTGFFEYSTDLFDRATVAWMTRHFLTLLRSIAANPTEAIANLPLLGPDERRRISIEWNDTAKTYRKLGVHQWFERQAKRAPKAPAVECGSEQLTYGELNRRANQLARFLGKLGARPEDLVGVCMERSLDMVIALLAVLKAGAAYLPLDARYPRERIAFMLEDSRAKLLLTKAKLFDGGNLWVSSRRVVRRNLQVVCLDQAWREVAKNDSRNLARNARPHNLACVIYTSGSTGRPKGVAIEHKNIAAFLQWARSVFSKRELSGVLASTSICFDLSLFELFAPLSSGGKVILVEDALAAADLCERRDITLINTVPSAMRELLSDGGLPPSVRTVNLAGEPLTSDLVKRLYETSTVEKVYDLYGPTETTVYSTVTLRKTDAKATIGRPIANSRVYLLDPALQPVPIGVPGEIFIGGEGVARGYLRRTRLTAERFFADPFAGRGGARMYRTGDLGRFQPDGSIEYLGRIDNQVKLRGYRIELGEIDAVLASHPAIRECAVVVRQTTDSLSESVNGKSKTCPEQRRGIENPKSEQLMAYFVAGGVPPSPISVRNFLREKLPEFMLPSVLTRIEALPRLPNGKVDRLALGLMDPACQPLTKDFAAPRSEIEEMIAQIWREVLKLDRIGVFDDFFESGGHSLSATRVIVRLRAALRVDLPLRKLFEARTVAGLAQAVNALGRHRSGVDWPAIVPARRGDHAPLSFAQRRLWFLHKLDPDLTAYNMPAAYRVSGPFQAAVFARALQQIIQRHEILRTVIVEDRGEPAQEIHPAAHLNVPVIDLTELPAQEVANEISRHADQDAAARFDLTAAPLMRVKILRRAEQEHIVLFNFHHMICDGSSLAVFYRELAAVYDALAAGREPVLAPLPAHYADFSLWQRQAFERGKFERQRVYWRQQLGGCLTPAELTADRQRPAGFTYRGAQVTGRVPREVSGALAQLAVRQHATLFMILVAALEILLARLTGRTDVIVGTAIAGRNRGDLEGLIGFFINAVALRADLSGNPPFDNLLRQVRDVCLDAYAHQDLPFEQVVEDLNPRRDLSRNPIFQVLFNMAEIDERELKLTDCAVTKINRGAPAAKFDLVVHAYRGDDGVELRLVYNADLFGAVRMQALLDQWLHLLAQIVDNPRRRVDQFSLVPPAAQMILPNPAEPLDGCWQGSIHSWFTRRAKEQPDKEAVFGDGDSWSYGEVDRLSNRLAHRLISDGIKPKQVVALYAHRDASLTVGLLGILKAGAVFAILDPEYPAARLVDYLRAAQPSGFLRMEDAGALPAEIESYLDAAGISARLTLPRAKTENARSLATFGDDAPDVPVAADDPAYIAFTSGSTGQPKGVLCRHGPMTYFFPWQEETFELKSCDRYALLSGLGYNHLHRDVFTTLALGARLDVPSEHDLRDPERLVAWLRRHEISILHLTPALGKFLQLAENGVLPSVRRVFFGGDVLSSQDVVRMREIAPNAILTSFYGATETQRAVGYFPIPGSPADSYDQARVVPIGRGAPGVQLLLLTQSHRLAGIGETGELYIRSPHLAAGYLGDPELSEANFITNPFSGDARDRLFRTRELSRYLPDGNVEWLGRNDRRASIRGFRVELGEIETWLCRCPGVRQAAVVTEKDVRTPSEESLAAYVDCGQRQQVECGALREFLTARLPQYMVPARFELIERMPLSPSGKIDYDALWAMEKLSSAAVVASEPPEGDLERRVAAIFAEVLQVQEVGRRDNFFALGGHSLSAARATARLREKLGAAVDLRAFLELATVEGICRRIAGECGLRAGGEDLLCEEREEIEL